MSYLLIEGGRRLGGTVPIHGAKNAVLPLLSACLLCTEECELHNCPRLSDVEGSLGILRHLGCRAVQEGDVITVSAASPVSRAVPDALMRQMRSSIVFLGAMIARLGEAHMAFPGGCELGPRPIDLHLSALRQMGAVIREENGHLHCRLNGRFRGCRIVLPFPSVGATENILLAAATAEGTTTLIGGAREPEILDLAAFLNACGARIGIGPDGTVTAEGVPALSGCRHAAIPDRIEAATYLAAAAATGGTVLLEHVECAHVTTMLPLFEEAGCRVRTLDGSLLLSAPPRLIRVRQVRTMPYPGFPTDAGAPLMGALCTAEGTSIFVETIFENRYRYVDELRRMGAHIKTEGRVAVVEGVSRLSGASVECSDLRGGAALVVAALAAEGQSRIGALSHLDRGYEALETGLSGLGASVRRVAAS